MPNAILISRGGFGYGAIGAFLNLQKYSQYPLHRAERAQLIRWRLNFLVELVDKGVRVRDAVIGDVAPNFD
jgi:hypothetical protein